METEPLIDFFYRGVWRMDWGFGNPNKTAALIVQLMLLACWLLPFGRRWRRFFYVLFPALAVCLLHTFSRGGAIALAAGYAVCLPWMRSLIRGKERWMAAVAVLLTILAAFSLGTPSRYVQGMASRDASIENRLKIWGTVPAMMRDAPGGWGSGRSGEAYTRWYQQEEDTARYRTLVGTHQTWLVEWGTWGRLLYLAGWIMAFMICLSARKGRAGPVPLGVWFSWGIACIFSSVGEEWTLWIIPILCLLAAVFGCRPVACRKIISHNMIWLLLSPAVLLLAAAWPREAGEEIFHNNHAVFVGKGERTDIWLMIDEQVLGNRAYAHALRRLAQDPSWRNMRVGVIEEGSRFLPESPDILLAAGDLNGHSWKTLLSRRPRLLVVLSPTAPPPSTAEKGETRLISFFGEFSRSSWMDAWKEQSNCRFLKSWGDYVPDLRPVLESLAGRDMP